MRPREVCRAAGALSEENISDIWTPGAIRKSKNKKTHTSHTRYRKTSKSAHLSHAHSNTAQQQQVLVMWQPSSTDKAHRTNKSADDHPNSWRSLRHRREAEPTREGTPAPAPAPVAHVVQRGPLPRVYPQGVELNRSVGPKGRHSYSTATKLGVVDNTRLRCYDGGVVGTVEPC